jgi:glycine/D-amino acid oxidase-like deaminating enzyme
VLIVSGRVMGTSIAVHLAEAGVRNVIPLESKALGA